RRRHTRLVSDWSSDVCSSDLAPETPGRCAPHQPPSANASYGNGEERHNFDPAESRDGTRLPEGHDHRRRRVTNGNRNLADNQYRSEERRVGKEWRSRMWTDH